jgi:diguanylate cyclase (GGDEF)-like protein/PAS domain S-box-containing protein
MLMHINCIIRALLHSGVAMPHPRISPQLAVRVFDAAREGILITDSDNHVIAVNPAFTTITGYSEEEMLDKNPSFLASGQQDDAFYEAMWSSLKASDGWRGRLWNRRKSGELYLQLLTISVVRDDAGHITNYIALFSDISDIEEYERQLRRIADHDLLSGLPNRRLLLDRLQKALAQARRGRRLMAVCFLDLDHFKSVNDKLGHDAGDRLLVETARRLEGSVRAGDTVARLGGDEFVLLLLELNDLSECESVVQRTLANIAAPVQLGTGEACVTASIGVALFAAAPAGDDEADAHNLLRCADRAMYAAKVAGRNRYSIAGAP